MVFTFASCRQISTRIKGTRLSSDLVKPVKPKSIRYKICLLSIKLVFNFHLLFRYIQQYLKIFTEEGRRAVTIKHNLIERPSENRADDESNIFYSTLKKPVNSSPVLSGLPFNNYFDSKLSLSEFNDKQLHAYQLFLQQQFKQQHQQKQQQTNNEALFQQVKRIKTASKEDYKPAPLAYPSTQINSSTSSTNSSPRTFTNIQPARYNL
jgi:hypothetical protein